MVCSYWDQSKVEVNIAKQKNPLIGKIVSCARMVGPSAPGETCNIVIDHQGKFRSCVLQALSNCLQKTGNARARTVFGGGHTVHCCVFR